MLKIAVGRVAQGPMIFTTLKITIVLLKWCLSFKVQSVQPATWVDAGLPRLPGVWNEPNEIMVVSL